MADFPPLAGAFNQKSTWEVEKGAGESPYNAFPETNCRSLSSSSVFCNQHVRFDLLPVSKDEELRGYHKTESCVITNIPRSQTPPFHDRPDPGNESGGTVHWDTSLCRMLRVIESRTVMSFSRGPG